MKRYEAHNILSRMLGDETANDSSTVYNGRRFSAELRDGYLFRAMTAILRGGLDEVSKLPPRQSTIVLRSLFPLSTVGLGISFSTGINEPLGRGVIPPPAPISLNTNTMKYFFAFTQDTPVTGSPMFEYIPMKVLSLRVDDGNRSYGVVLRENDSMDYGNSNINRRPDLWAEYSYAYRDTSNNPIITGVLDLYDSKGLISTTNSTLHIRFLRFPKHPANQGAAEELYIDETHIDQMFKLAMFYGMTDSQEIEDWSLLMPTMLGLNNANT